MDWGSSANGILNGGSASDSYRVGPSQGAQQIVDLGGSDVLQLYVGSACTSISSSWFIRDGEDLLVRIPDGVGNWLVDVRISDMAGAGAIERMELYSGTGYRLTDVTDLIGRWLDLGGERNSFFDDFERSAGPVGNGWLDMTDDQALVLADGAVTVDGLSSGGIYRSIDLNSTDTVSFSVSEHNGFGGLSSRFVSRVLFGTDGTGEVGYGVVVYRGDENFNNSAVQLILDGEQIDILYSNFQFESILDVVVTILEDGTVKGSVSEGQNTFYFDFGPREIELGGSNVAFTLEGPDTRSNSFIYPTLDNIEFSRSVPELNLTGTAAADVIDGQSASDGLRGLDGADLLRGADGDDTLLGGPGADQLQGGLGADTLYGGADADILEGGDGDDLLVDASADNDVFVGGAGFDIVSYAEASAAVAVSLADTGPQATGGAGTDTITEVEGLIGSAFNDLLVGDDQANSIEGWAGHDNLYGGDGDDLLIGDDGSDKAFGGDGSDTLYGGDGADALRGENGDDELHGDADADFLDGGAGDDSVDAGFGDDVAKGGAGSDVVMGGEGNDVVEGNDGDDVLYGGAGEDLLAGGRGSDRFVFVDGDLGGASAATDLIKDYKWADGDIVDLSGIDADTTQAGDQAFSFVGSFTGIAGEATLTFASGTTTMAMDTDGDGVGDLFLTLTGNVTSNGIWVL